MGHLYQPPPTLTQDPGNMEGECKLVDKEVCERLTSGLTMHVAHISSHQLWLTEWDQVSEYSNNAGGRSSQQLTVAGGGKVILFCNVAIRRLLMSHQIAQTCVHLSRMNWTRVVTKDKKNKRTQSWEGAWVEATKESCRQVMTDGCHQSTLCKLYKL